jgi:hypothetical protein
MALYGDDREASATTSEQGVYLDSIQYKPRRKGHTVQDLDAVPDAM